MVVSSNLTSSFMDCLLLLFHTDSVEYKHSVKYLVDLIEEDTLKTPTNNTPVYQYFLRLTRELLKINDSVSKDEKAAVIAKLYLDSFVQSDSVLKTLLDAIFVNYKNMTHAQVNTLLHRIRNTISWYVCQKQLTAMYHKFSTYHSTTDEDVQSSVIAEVCELGRQLTEKTKSFLHTKNRALETIDLSDKESIRKGLSEFKTCEVEGIIKLGLDGLNIAAGPMRLGYVPGETVVFAALPHMYKSGMLLSVARGIARYNRPRTKEFGVPTILFISLENEANKNLMWWFRTAYETTFQKTSFGLTDDEVIDFVFDFYNESGYKLVIERRHPKDFGFNEYVQLIENYEASGHHVVSALVDYVNLMNRNSPDAAKGARDDILLRMLYSSLCNYNKAKGILFFTAHALNRVASELAASGKSNIVRYFNGNMMADAMDVEREVDVIVYMHLETNASTGQRYLTCYKSKHRYVDNIPEAHKYFAYPFTEFGICDDYGKDKPGFTRDIYADKPANGSSSTGAQEEELCSVF